MQPSCGARRDSCWERFESAARFRPDWHLRILGTVEQGVDFYHQFLGDCAHGLVDWQNHRRPRRGNWTNHGWSDQCHFRQHRGDALVRRRYPAGAASGCPMHARRFHPFESAAGFGYGVYVRRDVFPGAEIQEGRCLGPFLVAHVFGAGNGPSHHAVHLPGDRQLLAAGLSVGERLDVGSVLPVPVLPDVQSSKPVRRACW
mmetsp:Transcript_17785/g.39248  ORF Transcript_17785/g.39248 Transcript_17785/m.39248 type:complete len:201 (+) Transcript_17785:220-822(+)